MASLLISTILAFSGAGPTGGAVSNVFTMPPVYKFPDLSGKVRVVFVAVFFRGGKAVVYSVESTLDDLADKGLLGEMFDGFVDNFGAVGAVGGGVDIQ